MINGISRHCFERVYLPSVGELKVALSIVKPVRRGLSANSTQSSLSSHHKYSGASHRLSAAANVGFVSDGGFPCRLSGLTFGRNDTAVAASEVGALRVLGSCHSGRRYTQRHSRLHPHLDSPCPALGRRTADCPCKRGQNCACASYAERGRARAKPTCCRDECGATAGLANRSRRFGSVFRY